MASDISTLSSFFTEVTRLLDGEDPTISDISVASLSRLAKIAQRRIYRDVRTRYNEKAFTALAVTGNAATLPADFEEAKQVHFGKQPLEPISESLLRAKLDDGGAGDAMYFAKVQSTFKFFPAVSDTTLMQGSYYARLPDLVDGGFAGNPLFQAADDLFIFACLVESAPFFGEKELFPVWSSKYAQIVESLNHDDMMSGYGVGRMKRRPSTRIIR